jgi:hypothetical protein
MRNPEKSENGKTVDFLLCAKRDFAAAEDFSAGVQDLVPAAARHHA